jgi:cysteinyl-tRNA synthetase
LKQAATSVDRLRNFGLRLNTGRFADGSTEAMAKLARETSDRMRAAMEDDLNTAQAQAAIFDMVRAANAAFDADQIKSEDVKPLLVALDQFDELFAVLNDDDASKMKAVVEWAKTVGREQEINADLLEIIDADQLSDADIEQKISAMKTARGARDFQTSDKIRAELTEAGILVEIGKDGIRWRRK